MLDNVVVHFIQEYFWIQVVLVIVGGGMLCTGIFAFITNVRYDIGFGISIGLPMLLFGGFCASAVVVPKINESVTHAEMMESCFDVVPMLRTTLNNLDAETEKWEVNRLKFVQMRDAAQTSSGRSLAEIKLSKIDSVLADLNEKSESVLGQVEMIAMESAGQFTDLDRRALEDLSHQVEDSVTDASELREGLSGD